MIDMEATKKTIPKGPGVYFFYSKNNIIYIGKAKNLQKRILSYYKKTENDHKVTNIVSKADRIDWILSKNEKEALILESELIHKHKPRYNTKLKEKNSYSRLAIDYNSDFPKIFQFKGENNKNLHIFGPYPQISAKTAIDSLIQTYPIRSCKDTTFKRAKLSNRACMLFDLDKCSAPCIGKIDKTKHYDLVKQLESFLRNESKDKNDILINKMTEAAENENFEMAKYYRNKINLLNSFQYNGISISNPTYSADSFSINQYGDKMILGYSQIRRGTIASAGYLFFDKGIEDDNKLLSENILNQFYNIYSSNEMPLEIILEKNEILSIPLFANSKTKIIYPKSGYKLILLSLAQRQAKEAERIATLSNFKDEKGKDIVKRELKTMLNTDKDIERIEVYDNSHFMGKSAIAGVVAFYDGVQIKNDNRKITLEINNGDDLASMREIAIKRYTKNKLGYNNFPDLILIDGGREQLKFFYNALKSLNVSEIPLMIAIAKENEEIYFVDKKKPLPLLPGSDLYLFITMLRDTAHNNALAGHRNKNLRDNKKEIFPFLSSRQREALFSTFGDTNAIYQASFEDIKSVKYIGEKSATILYDHISKKN
jgi:excinuclease ABC subunit C